MKINEIDNLYGRDRNSPTYPIELEGRLRKMGWQYIGSGVYGRIYRRGNKVLKLFFFNDKCFMEWVKYARMHPNNPHVPKFSKIYKNVAQDYHAVISERLNELSSTEKSEILGLISASKSRTKYGSIYQDDNKSINTLADKYPELMQTIVDFHKTIGRDCNWDLHPGNIMKRGDTYVINDPVSGTGGTSRDPVAESEQQEETLRYDLYLDKLYEEGWQGIGRGYFSQVFQKGNEILKVFQARDKCFIEFLRFCVQNPSNPHLPKFTAMESDVAKTHLRDKRYHMVKTTILDPMPRKLQLTILGELKFRFSPENTKLGKHNDTLRPPTLPEPPEIDDFFEKYPLLIQTIVQLHKEIKDCHWDLHRNNLMMRGDVPVIIDPVASLGNYEDKPLDL